MGKQITFLLPGSGGVPVGGFKVAYEYANGLANRGHEVTVIHPAILFKDTRARHIPKKIVRYVQRKMDGSYRPDSWFKTDQRVRLMWVPSLHPKYVPDGDVIIATAWQTAEWLDMYSAQKGKKACIVYDFEHYMSSPEIVRKRIMRVLVQPMKTVASSPAVSRMLHECGASDITYISNGIDLQIFRKEAALDDRCRDSVGFPARREMFKGTEDAIKAMYKVRERFHLPLRFWSFGGGRPNNMPGWVEYHERPSDQQLRALYNRTLVFAVPSHYEGWGLPGAEAMSCGAALASTDNGGVRAYAEHGRNALLSSPQKPQDLAENIVLLLNDSALRLQLADAGYTSIQEFSWERAVKALDDLVEELVERGEPRFEAERTSSASKIEQHDLV